MKKILSLIILTLIANVALAQDFSENQRKAAAYVLENIKIKSTAVRYLTDVCRSLDTLLLTCSVKINENGIVDDVKITQGLDEMFDESIRTTLFLMPKGVCAPATEVKDNYFTLLFNVYIDEIRDIQIARDIENYYKRKKFARVDLANADFQRYNPTVYELYKSTPTLNSSLWIIRTRATNLRFFSTMVK